MMMMTIMMAKTVATKTTTSKTTKTTTTTKRDNHFFFVCVHFGAFFGWVLLSAYSERFPITVECHQISKKINIYWFRSFTDSV